MPQFDYDLFVVGAGSGGVRAARVAAAHAARVAVAEDLSDARRFGWNVPTFDFDWLRLRANIFGEVQRLEGIYAETLSNHPPLAGVGLTEAAAREAFRAVKVFVSDFRPMKNVLVGVAAPTPYDCCAARRLTRAGNWQGSLGSVVRRATGRAASNIA